MAERREPQKNGSTADRLGTAGKPAGIADIASLRRASTSALILPSLNAPTSYTPRAETQGLYRIAEGLLDAGILQESDWYEPWGLVGSVVTGLMRYVAEQGAQELKYLHLELAFTDDMEQWGLPGCNWRSVDERKETGNVGGFGILLQTDALDVPLIGETIERLEALTPGAGESVLHVLYRALNVTVRAWTPAGAAEWMEQDWYQMEVHEGTFEGISRADFDAAIPSIALDPAWKPEAIEQAKRLLVGRDSASGIFYVAEELYAVCEAWREHRIDADEEANEIRDFDMEQLYPVVLDWKKESPVCTIFDDWQEMIYNCGEWTNVLWVQGFLSNDVPTILRAAAHLPFLIRLVGLCDTLISYLDTREPEPQDVTERARVQI